MGQEQVGETLGSTQTQLPVQVESPWASPQIPLPVERATVTLSHERGRHQQVGRFENAPFKGRAGCFSDTGTWWTFWEHRACDAGACEVEGSGIIIIRN